MNDESKDREAIAQLPDDIILREAVTRLRHGFYQRYGRPFLFGSFDFVFHSGKLQWIEECPRARRYVKRTKKPPVSIVQVEANTSI